MFRYQIGRIEERWENLVPPIQGGQYREEPKANGEASLQQSTPSFDRPSELAFLDSLTVDEVMLTMDKYPPLDQNTQDGISRNIGSFITKSRLRDYTIATILPMPGNLGAAH